MSTHPWAWTPGLRIPQAGTIRPSNLAHGLKHLGTVFRYVIKVAFKLVRRGKILSEMILENLAKSLEKKWSDPLLYILK